MSDTIQDLEIWRSFAMHRDELWRAVNPEARKEALRIVRERRLACKGTVEVKA